MWINRFKNCFFRIHKVLLSIWVVLWCVITFFAKRELYICDVSDLELVLQQYYTFFYPAGLILLMVVTFYPFLEGEGRELLYAYQRNYAFEALIVLGLMSLLLLFSVLIFWDSVLNNPFQFVLKNIILLLFFTGVCYFLLYAFKRMTIMIIGAVLILLVVNMNPFGLLNVLQYDVKSQTNLELICFMKEHLLIGSACFISAMFINKRYCQYTAGL